MVAKLVNLAQNQYRQVVALASAAGQHAFRWLVEERCNSNMMQRRPRQDKQSRRMLVALSCWGWHA